MNELGAGVGFGGMLDTAALASTERRAGVPLWWLGLSALRALLLEE